MKKKFILFGIAIFLMLLTAGFITGILLSNDDGAREGFAIGLIIGFVFLLIIFVILAIECLPDLINNNPEEDDLRVYALKNSKYHSIYRGQTIHPLANTGSVSKLRRHSRFSLSSGLKKAFIIIIGLLLTIFPTVIIIIAMNRIEESDSMVKMSVTFGILCFFLPMIIGGLIYFFGSKNTNITALEAKTPLLDLIEKDEELELVDKRLYKSNTYFELKIDDSRGFFEISNTSVMAIILGQKSLAIRNEVNEKTLREEIVSYNGVNEQLEGAIALSRRYKKPITNSNSKEVLAIIKTIVNEYENRKPSLFDRLNEEVKK